MHKDTQVSYSQTLSRHWSHTGDLSIEDWFAISRARCIESPIPMPSGPVLNLGAGNRPIGNSTPHDREHGWHADVDPSLPYKTGEVAGIWAHAFFDYIADPIPVLVECQRVLKSGGVMNIVGPHGLSDLWAEDVLRKTRWTEETWRTLLDNPWYDPQSADGLVIKKFRVHTCFIMGVVWRNLSLFTQLVKE